MAKVAFLGLGVMGYPMAGHLQAAGHEVTVYNHDPEDDTSLRQNRVMSRLMDSKNTG